MKTIGRILIILVVTALVGGVVYALGNAGGAALGNFPGRDRGQFQPGGGPPPRDQFQPGATFSNRPERGGDRHDGDGGLVFGLIKNLGIIAVIVTVIALPKSIARANRKAAAVANTNGGNV